MSEDLRISSVASTFIENPLPALPRPTEPESSERVEARRWHIGNSARSTINFNYIN